MVIHTKYMFIRKVLLGLFSIGILSSVVGYVSITNLTNAKVIDLDKYKDENILLTPVIEESADKKDADNFVEYLTLVFTGAIPTFGFIWWVLNSQQEKKIIEFSQSQDIKFKALMKEVIDKQDETTKSFSNDVKELIKKIDDISESFHDNRLEHVEKISQLNEKVNSIMLEIKMLQNTINKINQIESFLNKHFDEYNIRN